MNKEEKTTEAQELIDFISKSPSAFHATQQLAEMLEGMGCTELRMEDNWELHLGGQYYVRYNGTALVAFNVPALLAETGYRMIASHSDSPTFRVKPNAERALGKCGLKLNTESYGGSLHYTWFDRPLSLAGRVMLSSDDPLRPTQQLVDLSRPIGVIPSVAIHMNRGVNDGFSTNKQVDMQIWAGTKGFLSIEHLLAENLGVDENDILDYDLYAYDVTPGTLVGTDEELILAPKQDNLTMAFTSAKAFIDSSECNTHGRMLIVFDNEEVGSNTKQGAASPLVKDILRRIVEKYANAQGLPPEETYQRTIYNSFLVSADMAHALHPNHPELHDPTNWPMINHGPVIKYNAAQKYMTDADSAAVFMSICQNANVPYQQFVNRSDMAGGSTLGNILTQQIGVRGVDMGAPLIGMHSCRETGGAQDVWWCHKAFTEFYCTGNE